MAAIEFLLSIGLLALIFYTHWGRAIAALLFWGLFAAAAFVGAPVLAFNSFSAGSWFVGLTQLAFGVVMAYPLLGLLGEWLEAYLLPRENRAVAFLRRFQPWRS